MEKYEAIKAKRLFDVYPDETDVVMTEWMVYYTSTSDLQEIRLHDNTVEIIGCAHYLGPLEQTVTGDWSFKCILKNDENQSIEFTAFNADAKRLYYLFRQDYVMHIDGALSVLRSSPAEEGALNIELQAQSNTLVNCLGSQDIVWNTTLGN